MTTDATLPYVDPGASEDPAVRALVAAIEDTAATLRYLLEATTRLKEVDDFDTAAHLLADATALTATAKTAAGAFHDRAWALRGDHFGNYHHPALGIVSIRRTAARPRWDHPALAERVVEQHVRANEGEAPDPTEVTRWLLDAAAFGYWRKGKLADLGIDPSGEDLYWFEPGTPTITFPSVSG